MTYVVTEACVRCKYSDCVDVCPVDCFHEGPNFLVIDPVECIDCSLCVPECPVGAIYEVSEVPERYAEYTALNAALAKRWPVIAQSRDPLPDAEAWADVENKREHLDTGDFVDT